MIMQPVMANSSRNIGWSPNVAIDVSGEVPA